MSDKEKVEIDLASYPDYENLISEVRIGDKMSIVLSREPDENEIFVSIYPSDLKVAPSSSNPNEESRVSFRVLLSAIQMGRNALEGDIK